MKEDWTEQMKQKLEGHRMPPPDGLWESISKEMGIAPEPVRQQPVIRRWWWAAAAAVLALVGFFAFHNGNDNEPPLQVSVVSQQPVSQQPSSLQSAETSPVENEHPSTALFLAFTTQNNKVSAPSDLTEQDLPPVAEKQTEESLPDFSTETQQTIDEPQPKVEKRNPPQADASSQMSRVEELSTWTSQTAEPDAHQNRWSVGLNASGGLLAANTSQRTDRLYHQYSNVGSYSFGENISSSYTLTEYAAEHHLPIRFGLSLHYLLSSRLALNSGINYTYLFSKFSIPLYENVAYDQKLHYLGIPLGLTWQLWSAKSFHLYVSGGVMLEKCVSAQLEGSGTVSKKPWQWSVEAAAGAEYVIIPQLGLYLEPSLGYYFDDGTSLEHYYKEHPLAPSIEFGLRLHLNE